ncbi:alpha/beta hydrolase [Lachnospiraceae bacterium ZAX-1]
MMNETLNLWEEGAYNYPAAFGFIPTITTYLHGGDANLPAMIVVPGGGYTGISPTEGELVAKKFYDMGYQAFVVTYTTNTFMTVPLKMQPLEDLSKAIMMVRKHAKKWHIKENQVTVCGFSAGGHLAGSLSVHYASPNLCLGGEYEGISNRPDAVILSYPVITSGEYAHRESFIALLGKDASAEELEKMSLEKQVKADTPPAFLWQTATDEVVPVENSYLFAQALKTQEVLFEHHVFSTGKHGLSLANEDWATGRFGGMYTLQQLYCSLKNASDNGTDLPEPFWSYNKQNTFEDFEEMMKVIYRDVDNQRVADASIAIWPMMADLFLKKLFVHFRSNTSPCAR